MKTVNACLALLAVISLPAHAWTPEMHRCIVSLDDTERLLMIPDDTGNAHAGFYVIVRNEEGTPIPNAIVEVIVGGQGYGHTRLCGGEESYKVTDANGRVDFEIHGGGCYKNRYAVAIRANGIEIRTYDVIVSPDYAGWDNDGIPNRWSLSMTPEDMASFMRAYQGGTGGPSCHDYDNNDRVDPADLSVFASAYKGGSAACVP